MAPPTSSFAVNMNLIVPSYVPDPFVPSSRSTLASFRFTHFDGTETCMSQNNLIGMFTDVDPTVSCGWFTNGNNAR